MSWKDNQTCDKCWANISKLNSVCKYCWTLNKSNSNLSDKDIEKIKSVVSSLEDSLKSSLNNNFIAWISFLILWCSWVWSYFILWNLLESKIETICLTIFVCCIFFVFFWFILQYTDNFVANKKYETDIKNRINNYLTSTNYTRYDFDIIAEKKLKKKSLLKRFLFRK